LYAVTIIILINDLFCMCEYKEHTSCVAYVYKW